MALTTLALDAFSQNAAAAIVNFETGYAEGSLVGQDGWIQTVYSGNNATVTTVGALSGVFSVLNDAASARSDISRGFAPGSFETGNQVSYLQKIIVDSTPVAPNVFDGGSGIYIGPVPGQGWSPLVVRFNGGVIEAMFDDNGAVNFQQVAAYNVGDVYRLTIQPDFPGDRYSVEAFDVTTGAAAGSLANINLLTDGPAFDPATDEVGFSLTQFTGSAMFDDIITSPIVPEPSPRLMMTFASAALLLRQRRRASPVFG